MRVKRAAPEGVPTPGAFKSAASAQGSQGQAAAETPAEEAPATETTQEGGEA